MSRSRDLFPHCRNHGRNIVSKNGSFRFSCESEQGHVALAGNLKDVLRANDIQTCGSPKKPTNDRPPQVLVSDPLQVTGSFAWLAIVPEDPAATMPTHSRREGHAPRESASKGTVPIPHRASSSSRSPGTRPKVANSANPVRSLQRLRLDQTRAQ